MTVNGANGGANVPPPPPDPTAQEQSLSTTVIQTILQNGGNEQQVQDIKAALQKLLSDEKNDPSQVAGDTEKLIDALATSGGVTTQQLDKLDLSTLAAIAELVLGSPDITPPRPGGSNVNPQTVQSMGGNAWLGGLVTVTLTQVMAEIYMSDAKRALQDVMLWVMTQDMLKSCAQSIASLDIQKGQAEFKQYMMMAVTAAVSLAGQAFAVGKGGARSAELFQMAQQTGSMGENIIKGITTLQTSQMDAQIELLKNYQQMLQSVADRLTQDEKSANSELDSAIQNMMKWSDALAQAFNKLGPQ